MSDSGSDDGDWEDWGEPEVAPTRCLFDESRTFDSAAECLAHAAQAHGLHLAEVARGLSLYDRVRLVNYVRSELKSKPPPAVVAAIGEAATAERARWPWADDTYLQPVVADDPLLYSLGGNPAVTDGEVSAAQAAADDAEADAADAADEADDVEYRARGGGDAAGALLETVEQMRSEVALLINEMDGGADGKRAPDAGPPTAEETAPAEEKASGEAAAAAAGAAAEGKREGEYGSSDGVGSAYFSGYAALGIHETMLSDAVRTEAYRDAMLSNKSVFEGKTVLDVGCGTGILSLFAAQAGAKRVIGVDASDIIDSAKLIVAKNNFSDRVTLLKGTMETLSLPDGIETVDIIISEWMGYALLYESMLPTVLFARDKYLAKGGLVLPSSCDMAISACSYNRLGFWADVYGFDMGNMADTARKEASVEVLPAESLLSKPAIFRTIDCTTVPDAALDFTCEFSLTATTAGTLHCFAVHFDSTFDLTPAGGKRSSFSTSAEETPTHWKQTALYLTAPQTLKASDVVSGTVSFTRGIEYKRGYDVAVSYSINGAYQATQLWRME